MTPKELKEIENLAVIEDRLFDPCVVIALLAEVRRLQLEAESFGEIIRRGVVEDYQALSVAHEELKQVAKQQQQQIEQLKCCGNCVHWVENTYMCRVVVVDMPLRFDKCDKWQGVE